MKSYQATKTKFNWCHQVGICLLVMKAVLLVTRVFKTSSGAPVSILPAEVLIKVQFSESHLLVNLKFFSRSWKALCRTAKGSRRVPSAAVSSESRWQPERRGPRSY